VLARRLLFMVALLLLVSLLAGGVVDRERDRESRQATATETAPATTAPLTAVTGRLPDDKVVRARVGDLVRITVVPPRAGDATIDALGVSEETDPIVPGTLEFVASDPGRYPVQLDGAGPSLGTVVVAPEA
jgi:hypothetical protein